MSGGIKRFVVMAIASIALGALFAPAHVGAQEDASRPDTVTVGARQEVDIEPDIGTVNFGVRVHASSAAGATEKLSDRTRRVIAALESAGFSDDEIDTHGVQLQRVCLDNCRDPNPRDDKIPTPILGYRGSAGVRVETEQLDRLGEVIDIGIRAGANSIRGISFDVSDKTAAVNEALRQAMQIAVDKARILAEVGDRELGPAIIIEEGNTRAPDLYVVRDAAVYGRSVEESGSAGAGGGTSSNPFPVEPPTLTASARVTVTFELN